MASPLKIAVIFASLTSAALATEADPNLLQTKLASTPYRLAAGLDKFSRDVYSTVARGESGNVVVSPFSLHAALSMVFFGSPANSETHEELVRLLGLPKQFYDDYAFNYLKLLSRYDATRRGKVTVGAANKVYVDDTFAAKEPFLDFMRIFYRATVDQVDFADSFEASRAINRYVDAKTHGKIKNLLEPTDVDALTRIALVNAIYFKGDWKTKFERSRTASRPFTVAGETFQHPETMATSGLFRMGEVAALDATALELPYADEDYRMLVFLPRSNASGAVRDLDAKLGSFDVNTVDGSLVRGRVLVEMPKFKASGRAQMSRIFEELGARTLFDAELANLTDISDEPDLHVQKVIHQAEVEVNEEGSEAAAATAVVIGTRTAGAARKPRVFKANRPFVFVIQDRALGVPLFVGRVVDPSGRRQLGSSQQAGPQRLNRQVVSAALVARPLQQQQEAEEEDSLPGPDGITFPEQ